MCGIAVLLQLDGAPADATTLQQMTNAMNHRGPDGAGVHASGAVGLGHRRLSIIDLEGGRQPLSNEDGTVWITFNGEIYNYRELQRELVSRGHRFRTNSDTETIVHAYEEWGVECLGRLRGMFAFAIWDEKRRELFLARDRFGIKPLLYWEQPGLFGVASEMQALQAHPDFHGMIDPAAIDMYLHFQYIPAPYSIYNEVRKLPPAHFLVVRSDGSHAQPKRYWDFAFQPDRSLDEAEWVERLDAALRETVATHLVSDVPFGAFLSGGIDSSTILAYMQQLLPAPVKAFTIGHSSPNYDERTWAAEAAGVCGAEHFVEVVEPDAMELLPTLVRHFGEPFADSSAIATYHVSRLAREHVKMVLSGDGGDELFAGYHSYTAILWETDPPLNLAQRAKHWLADRARAGGIWPRRPTLADYKYERMAVLAPALRRSLWTPDLAHLVDFTRRQFDEQFVSRRRECQLGQLQHHDITNYVAFDNLPKVDTASMCHGLEVRVPLLDHVFLQTAAQIPPEFKMRAPSETRRVPTSRFIPGESLVGKYLLKKNGERFFSRQFLHRHKLGFEVPVQDWFNGQYRQELERRLTGADSLLADYFQPEMLQTLVQDARVDRAGAWRGWSLLVLEEWLQQSRSRESLKHATPPNLPRWKQGLCTTKTTKRADAQNPKTKIQEPGG